VTATAIAPPEPGLTEADLVERARRLVPVLRERQEETEGAGRILDETCRDFLDAGFYRILQPRRFGGYELDLAAFSRVAIELGRGCPSSAWTYALTAGHIHMLSALFSEDAQVDVYGEDGDVRMPGNLRLLGDAVPVEGGYRLTGAWDYLSGCDVATHLVLGARVPEAGGEPERRLMLIADAAPFEIVDNWDVLGLRGTGSRRVVAENVFVPECRAMTSYYELDMRTAPGRRVHANPLYAGGGPTALIFGEITAVAVGAARGVLDLYELELRTRNTTVYPIQPMKDNPEYHRLYGEAVQLIEVADAAVLGSDHEYMECARRDVEEGIPFSRGDELRMMLRKQYVCKLALDAVDLMLRTVGSSSMRTGAMLQRYRRDLTMLATHNTVQPELAAGSYGRLYLSGALDGSGGEWLPTVPA
jgi:3-hydroxy-9,10-secoandrosta-1,3,5(10)-triene-9,17-dione monooxygenase